MTVPFEQLMALKMGRQALTIIIDDEKLTPVARGTAQWLLHLYASEKQLDAGVIAETDPLRQCAAVLSATGTFFAVLVDGNQGSERTQRALRATLRHYPADVRVHLNEGPLIILNLGSMRAASPVERQPFAELLQWRVFALPGGALVLNGFLAERPTIRTTTPQSTDACQRRLGEYKHLL